MSDAQYTARDHAFRENDHYARAKYDITLRWLARRVTATATATANGASPGRLVNIGCGAGLFNRLAHEAGFAVEACEPDPDAYAAAVATAPPGAVVHLGDIFDAPIGPDADVVVMHDVLEHIADERAAVERLAALVRPDGCVVLSVPAMPGLFGLHDEQLGHYRRYTRPTLTGALAPEFSVTHLRAFGLTFVPVTAWYSRWRRRPYPSPTDGTSTFADRAFAAVCHAEARVPVPVGTSLLVAARPKRARR